MDSGYTTPQVHSSPTLLNSDMFPRLLKASPHRSRSLLRDIRVADGTCLGMLRPNVELKDQTISIRIAGIDAPEVSLIVHPLGSKSLA